MVLRLPDSRSNWNLKILVFEERGKNGVPGEKPFGARERTNNKLNPHMASTLVFDNGYIDGRRVLSPLRYPCFVVIRKSAKFRNLNYSELTEKYSRCYGLLLRKTLTRRSKGVPNNGSYRMSKWKGWGRRKPPGAKRKRGTFFSLVSAYPFRLAVQGIGATDINFLHIGY